ncbi:MAG TPA: c-type cytochrome [Terriglobia bacterium]|nr:c-type cytochrome [Terriglobia bacterium]
MRWRLAVLVIATLAAWGFTRSTTEAQIKVLPGSAARGGQLIITKGCINCHAFGGGGGKRAPDLTRTPPDASSPGQLATAMWNHAPQMWVSANRTWDIELSSSETADLFAFMYSALYFAPAGDAARGRALFEKSCATCHAEAKGAGGPGQPVATWAEVRDPLAWAGHMWNHSPQMTQAAAAKNRAWPTLSNQNVADLMIYFRSLPELREKSNSFSLGEPELGRVTFERVCESCHSFGPSRAGKKVDLLARSAPDTVTGYVAAMWNHAPRMKARADGPLPRLEPDEMPNLVAFLFSQSYFFERGDVKRGQRVYERENCARCHEQRRGETGAPDLTQPAEAYSPITLTASVWRHAPSMFEATRRSGVPWPMFEGSDMVDVIAYLNSRVVTRIAEPRPR